MACAGHFCVSLSRSSDEYHERDPHPSRFSAAHCGAFLDLDVERREAAYSGSGQHGHDVGAVLADCSVPGDVSVYYYEVTVVSAGEAGKIGVGFADSTFKLSRRALLTSSQRTRTFSGQQASSFSAFAWAAAAAPACIPPPTNAAVSLRSRHRRAGSLAGSPTPMATTATTVRHSADRSPPVLALLRRRRPAAPVCLSSDLPLGHLSTPSRENTHPHARKATHVLRFCRVSFQANGTMVQVGATTTAQRSQRATRSGPGSTSRGRRYSSRRTEGFSGLPSGGSGRG